MRLPLFPTRFQGYSCLRTLNLCSRSEVLPFSALAPSFFVRRNSLNTQTISSFQHAEDDQYNGLQRLRDDDRHQRVDAFEPPSGQWRIYTYSPLAKAMFTIRLMELEPGTDDDPIHCQLRTVHLGDERVQYQALSYTWGSQVFQQFVWCEGKVLPVTSNLHSALKRLRQPTRSTLLWIDAICINQEDSLERSDQVELMRQIYNRATQVVAWLAEADSTTQVAFDLIERISNATKDLTPEQVRDNFWSATSLASMGLPPFPNPEWYALIRLFGARYFTRIWVVQELVVSRQATVRCGNHTISWTHVERVARLLLATGWRRAFNSSVSTSPNAAVSPRAPVFAKTIANIRLSFSELIGGPGMSLSLLLCITRRFKATDPRDKILALLGVANNVTTTSSSHTTSSSTPTSSPSSVIIPDYTSPTTSVFLNVTGSLITSENSLTLLSLVEDLSRRKLLSLPSWVPDYSVWHSVLTFGFPLGPIRYNACGAFTSPTTHWTPSSPYLSVSGLSVDSVSAVATTAFDDTRVHALIVASWLELALPLLQTGLLSIDSIWRTMLGNCDRDTYPAPSTGGGHFAAYISHFLPDTLPLLRPFWKPLVGEYGRPELFQTSIETLAWQRKSFTTKEGRVGLGPRSMQEGDRVVVFKGAKVPFLVRRGGRGWRLVGECFCWGVMDGEAVEGMGVEGMEVEGVRGWEEFVLV